MRVKQGIIDQSSSISEPSDGVASKPISPSKAPDNRIANALTIDVEDYFHTSALSERIDQHNWDSIPLRVEQNCETILGLLEAQDIKATFFVLGWVADRCPSLVRQIAGRGHEIASHGYMHERVGRQTAAEFLNDVRRTRILLEDTIGAAVIGYRAASFSLTPDLSWAYAALTAAGYRYSSSLHPIRHDLYGARGAPRQPFRPSANSELVEIPVSTLEIGGLRLPCGGGGYFRLMPYTYSRLAIAAINRREAQPCTFYFHPWEIDPGQPRITNLGLRARFRHYTNLAKFKPKLRALLRDFHWTRMDRAYADVIRA